MLQKDYNTTLFVGFVSFAQRNKHDEPHSHKIFSLYSGRICIEGMESQSRIPAQEHINIYNKQV